MQPPMCIFSNEVQFAVFDRANVPEALNADRNLESVARQPAALNPRPQRKLFPALSSQTHMASRNPGVHSSDATA